VQASQTDKIPPNVVLHRTIDLIAARTVDVVPESNMTEGQKSCATEECLRALLQATKATHAIVLRFDPPDANIISHAELRIFSVLDPAYYASSISDTFTSPAEFEKRIAEDAAKLADEVVAHAHTIKPPPPLVYRPWLQRAWPWALVGAGAVSMGWGIRLIAEDHHRSCDSDPCVSYYATKNRGIAFLLSGAAVAAVGGLLGYKLAQPVSVSIGPGNIALGGQF
jgi:hypothetical protein